jgi:hypothetical protein
MPRVKTTLTLFGQKKKTIRLCLIQNSHNKLYASTFYSLSFADKRPTVLQTIRHDPILSPPSIMQPLTIPSVNFHTKTPPFHLHPNLLTQITTTSSQPTSHGRHPTHPHLPPIHQIPTVRSNPNSNQNPQTHSQPLLLHRIPIPQTQIRRHKL